MLRNRTVTLDFLPDSPLRYLDHDAVVCLDVLRATSTLVTSVIEGRRTYVAGSVADARAMAGALDDALLAGEVSGGKPQGFEMGNSPSALAKRNDLRRPLVLVSLSGTPLLVNAARCPAAYVACFRNLLATAEWIASRHERVAVLGAGSHGELRCEDQMAVAWMAERLMARGFEPETTRTRDLVRRWSGTSVDLAAWGNSADYLRRSGQEADLDFVLSHQDDAQVVCRLEGCEVRRVQPIAAIVKKGPVRSLPSSLPALEAPAMSVRPRRVQEVR